MAGAATVKTEWGYYVTNSGTDATSIWTDGRKYIKTIVFNPGSTADTCALTTTKNITGAATPMMTFKSAGAAGILQCPWHLDEGIPADNLAVAFSSSSGTLSIFLR
jgi:hypothetical protein